MADTLYPVPFHSQHWKLTAWESLGFTSEAEARYWERSCCGILCLQMAAEYFLNTPYQTSDLIRRGVALGAYSEAVGWNHQGLCLLAHELGLNAQSAELTPFQIHDELIHGSLVMVSIKWAFNPHKTITERLRRKLVGGHLALCIGTTTRDSKLTGLFVHHTSTKEAYNWQYHLIPTATFSRGYTGRAVILSRP